MLKLKNIIKVLHFFSKTLDCYNKMLYLCIVKRKLNIKTKDIMKNLFSKNDKVRFSYKGVEYVAVVLSWDYNYCTFEPCYELKCDKVVMNNSDEIYGVPQSKLSAA